MVGNQTDKLGIFLCIYDKKLQTIYYFARKVNEYIPLLFSTWLIILDDRTFVAFTHLEFFAPKISLCFNFQNVINWLLQNIVQDTFKKQDPSSTFKVLLLLLLCNVNLQYIYILYNLLKITNQMS